MKTTVYHVRQPRIGGLEFIPVTQHTLPRDSLPRPETKTDDTGAPTGDPRHSSVSGHPRGRRRETRRPEVGRRRLGQ